MPNKVIVKCYDCTQEFAGELPDYQPAGWPYMSIKGEIADKELLNGLLSHHKNTRSKEEGHGHIYYDVYRSNGDLLGEIVAGTYHITYKEKPKNGLERKG